MANRALDGLRQADFDLKHARNVYGWAPAGPRV